MPNDILAYKKKMYYSLIYPKIFTSFTLHPKVLFILKKLKMKINFVKILKIIYLNINFP